MAKNNGKFTLFLMLCMLIFAICFIVGMDKCEYAAKQVNFTDKHNMSTAIQTVRDREQNTSKSVKANGGKIELLCLMYHNIVGNNQKQGDYEVRVNMLEQDFAEIKKLGYTCVNRKKLLEVVDNNKSGKYAMITFDDGFYGVYKYVPKLLEKYDMSCIVSVVGEFMDRQDKIEYKTRCSYMNTNEVKELARNPRVEIAQHSYDYHHIKNGRKGVKIKNGETSDKYIQTFKSDTQKLTDKLKSIGVKTKTYCYPYGEYCKESESVLKNLKYQMTMTCNEHLNYVKGRESLYLLGRLNRSANCQNINNLIAKACNKK